MYSSSHNNAELVFSISSSLNSVSEKLRFRDGSVPTVEIKLRLSQIQTQNGAGDCSAFSNSSGVVWTENIRCDLRVKTRVKAWTELEFV